MFEINKGDNASFIDGGIPILDGNNQGQVTMAGAQGFPGFAPISEAEEDRHNFAAYIELDMQFYDKLSLGFAGRYEYYSDFGSTLNGKVSVGYQMVDQLLLRGSVSTGFRAPSLQQSFFSSISSISIDGEPLAVGTAPVGASYVSSISPDALEPETSEHFTVGFVFEPTTNFSLSADYFYTKIKDRIVFSGNVGAFNSPLIGKLLEPFNLFAVRSFLNAIDTETQGYDLRANYSFDFQQKGELKLTAAYHYNKNKIIGSVRSPAIFGDNGADIVFSEQEKERVELGQPNDSLILMAHYKRGDFDGAVKLIKAGAFSEAGQRPDSQWLADIDLAYQVHPNFNVAVGVHNLFDTEPERNAEDGTFLQSSPYGYNGGFYYFRLAADF
jgi:iron complex outermembrane receptor protein